MITNGSKFDGNSLEQLIDAEVDLIEFSVDADNEKDDENAIQNLFQGQTRICTGYQKTSFTFLDIFSNHCLK